MGLFGGGSQKVKTTAQPFALERRNLWDLWNQANALPAAGPYTGQTVAGFSPWQNQAMQGIADQAKGGNPLIDQAISQQQGTIGGEDLTSNPLFDLFGGNAAGGGDVASYRPMVEGGALGTPEQFQSAFRSQLRNVLPGYMSAAGAAGRGGSGLVADAMTNAAADAYGGLQLQNEQFRKNALDAMLSQQRAFGQPLGAAYDTERARQEMAAQRAPLMSEARYQDLDKLLQIGGMQQAQGQRKLDELRRKYEAAQLAPWERLANIGNLYQLGFGATGSTQVSPGPSSIAKGLSGALGGAALGGSEAGAALGSALGLGGPATIGLGAGLGLLTGLL